MNRTQWLFVVYIGVIAVVAYARSDQIARRLNFGQYREPTAWTA